MRGYGVTSSSRVTTDGPDYHKSDSSGQHGQTQAEPSKEQYLH